MNCPYSISQQQQFKKTQNKEIYFLTQFHNNNYLRKRKTKKYISLLNFTTTTI